MPVYRFHRLAVTTALVVTIVVAGAQGIKEKEDEISAKVTKAQRTGIEPDPLRA